MKTNWTAYVVAFYNFLVGLLFAWGTCNVITGRDSEGCTCEGGQGWPLGDILLTGLFGFMTLQLLIGATVLLLPRSVAKRIWAMRFQAVIAVFLNTVVACFLRDVLHDWLGTKGGKDALFSATMTAVLVGIAVSATLAAAGVWRLAKRGELG